MTKKKHFIFDLDDTLLMHNEYNIECCSKEFYEQIIPEFYLQYLLKNLVGELYIFSNGTKEHVIHSLKSLGLLNLFKYSNIYGRNTLNNLLKPDPKAFDLFLKKTKIPSTDEVIFFEDQKKNLQTAKYYNWKTVLISYQKKSPFVDYHFYVIEDALQNFQ